MNITQLLVGIGVISVAGGLSIYSGVSLQEIIVFNFDGSTSMRPIVEFLLDKYSKEQDKPISFNVSAIGSNSGLQKLLHGTAEFALVSHDISHLPKDKDHKDKWKKRQLKTVTLATESMVVLYKPPKECTSELTLSEENIKKVFSVFSGHKADDVNKPLNFKDLLDNGNDKCQATIHAWVKSTGPIKSGTAKSFVSIPLLKNVCESNGQNGKCGDWYTKVKSSYGSDYPLNYVPESTPLHWDSFKHNLRDGAITYLPSNFVLQNWDEIEKLGIKFAKYKKKQNGGNGTTFTWTKNQDTKDIEWQRSFNIVFSISDLNTNENKKKLLEFIIKNSQHLTELHLSAKCYSIKSSNGQTTTPTQCKENQKQEEIDLTCFDQTDDASAS